VRDLRKGRGKQRRENIFSCNSFKLRWARQALVGKLKILFASVIDFILTKKVIG